MPAAEAADGELAAAAAGKPADTAASETRNNTQATVKYLSTAPVCSFPVPSTETKRETPK